MPTEQLAAGIVEVDLTWVAGRMEHRVVFGQSLAERVTEPHRKTVTFAPASIFAVMRWAASDLGLTVARLEILREPRRHRAARTYRLCARPWIF